LFFIVCGLLILIFKPLQYILVPSLPQITCKCSFNIVYLDVYVCFFSVCVLLILVTFDYIFIFITLNFNIATYFLFNIRTYKLLLFIDSRTENQLATPW